MAEHESRARQLSSELANFVRIVSEEMNPEQILLFGSMAQGTIGEWSS